MKRAHRRLHLVVWIAVAAAVAVGAVIAPRYAPDPLTDADATDADIFGEAP